MKRNSISSITRFGMILAISAVIAGTWGGVSIPVWADSTSTTVLPDSTVHSTTTPETYGVYVGTGSGIGSFVSGNTHNTAIGPEAGQNVTGNNNTATGYGTGWYATGNSNTATGNNAGSTVSGSYNTPWAMQPAGT